MATKVAELLNEKVLLETGEILQSIGISDTLLTIIMDDIENGPVGQTISNHVILLLKNINIGGADPKLKMLPSSCAKSILIVLDDEKYGLSDFQKGMLGGQVYVTILARIKDTVKKAMVPRLERNLLDEFLGIVRRNNSDVDNSVNRFFSPE